MNMTVKPLSLLTLTLALGITAFTPAFADGHAKTSLVISDEVFVPKVKVNAPASETDMMPITDEVEQTETIMVKSEAAHAPTNLTPMPGQNLTIETKSLVIKPKEEVETVMSWRGRGGETLQDVLARWGGRVGHNFHWTTRDTSQLHRNFSYVGSFDDAVQELLVREVKSESYIQEYTHEKNKIFTGVKKNH